jgi:hypothetical protein
MGEKVFFSCLIIFKKIIYLLISKLRVLGRYHIFYILVHFGFKIGFKNWVGLLLLLLLLLLFDILQDIIITL